MARPVIRDGRPGLDYREAEVWQNQSTLLVTHVGAPEFRSVFPPARESDPGDPPKAYPFADPNRLASLTGTYAQLATSDGVKAIMRRGGPIRGQIGAYAIPAATSPA